MSKFKVGDKVILSCGKKWNDGRDYKTIVRINELGGNFYNHLKDSRIYWFDYELELYKEDKEVKELTFREVIANIKEGQVWENKSQRVSKIYINKSGNNQLEGEDNSFSSNFSTCVGPDVKYKLQRKEYTFEEAFKAYEEGEEIESIKSGCKYKGGKFKLNNQFSEWLPLRSIPIEEIEGEWYIND